MIYRNQQSEVDSIVNSGSITDNQFSQDISKILIYKRYNNEIKLAGMTKYNNIDNNIIILTSQTVLITDPIINKSTNKIHTQTVYNMQTLEWFTTYELPILQSMTLVKCVGQVRSVQQNFTYYSFTITDLNLQSNNSNIMQEEQNINMQHTQYSHQQKQKQSAISLATQATIYEQQKLYSTFNLPQKGQYVIVVGNTYKRQISRNSIIKIKVKLYRIIPKQTAHTLSILASKARAVRMLQKQQSTQMQPKAKTKTSLLKQLKITINPIQIRSLILSCVYITLQNNEDLNSYTFSLYTIQNHRLTKSYCQSKTFKEQAYKYMSEFIDVELAYLVDNQVIQLKQVLDNQKIYKVNRVLFTDIQMRTMGIIYEKQKTGTVLTDIVNILNRQRGFIQPKNFVYNENFVQKILKKFIQESRIYKTSQKVLYPNS